MSDVVQSYRWSYIAANRPRSVLMREAALVAITFVATFAFVSLVVGQLFFSDGGGLFGEPAAVAQSEPINFAENDRGFSVVDEFVPAIDLPDESTVVEATGLLDILLPTLLAMAAAFVLISMWFRSGNAALAGFTSDFTVGGDGEPALSTTAAPAGADDPDLRLTELRSREYANAPLQRTRRADDVVRTLRHSAIAQGALRQEPEFA